MKKSILILSALSLSASVQAADTFVAGWDFDNISSGTEQVNAQWGAQLNTASFYWNGTGPSTDFAQLNPPLSFATESQIDAIDASVGNNFLVQDAGTGFNAFSENFGGTVSNLQFVGNDGGLNSQRAIIQFNASSFSELVIQFAALNSGSGTIDFTWSRDGITFNALESAVSYGSSYEVDSLSLAALDGASTAFIGIEFNNAANEIFSFDNIQIVGTATSAIPEPSTFGALAGALALGAAAVRRRRS